MRKRDGIRSDRRTEHRLVDDTPKKTKYDYHAMRIAATSDDDAVRKTAFIDYFERFGEFPSYVFDNESKIDERLHKTALDLLKDPDTSKAMHKGIVDLLARLPTE